MNGQSVESSQQLLLKLVFVDVKAKKRSNMSIINNKEEILKCGWEEITTERTKRTLKNTHNSQSQSSMLR